MQEAAKTLLVEHGCNQAVLKQAPSNPTRPRSFIIALSKYQSIRQSHRTQTPQSVHTREEIRIWRVANLASSTGTLIISRFSKSKNYWIQEYTNINVACKRVYCCIHTYEVKRNNEGYVYNVLLKQKYSLKFHIDTTRKIKISISFAFILDLA